VSGPDLARQGRRRAEQERQRVVFGVIFAVLAVTALAGAAVYTNTVQLPFLSRPFSTPKTSPPPAVPCPPDGALPISTDQITVNVLNATTQGGLASSAADTLTSAGFVIGTTGNSTTKLETPQIVFGPSGIVQAYTLRAYAPHAVLQYDSARTGATVDLVLGSDDVGLTVDPGLDSTTPLQPATGCADLTSTPTPTP